MGKTLRVGGWVKTGREAGAGAFGFLEVNDGSCFDSIQVMVPKEVADAVGGLKALVSTGTSVLVEGELTETPEGTKQVRMPACFNHIDCTHAHGHHACRMLLCAGYCCL